MKKYEKVHCGNCSSGGIRESDGGRDFNWVECKDCDGTGFRIKVTETIVTTIKISKFIKELTKKQK